MTEGPPASWEGLVRPWWERGTVPCRDATPSSHCSEHTWLVTECETEVDPATQQPVKRCVKLYKRYLKCAGRPDHVDEQKQEMTARGEGAQELEPDLVLPSNRRAAAPGEQPGPQMEDVGHAVQEFLRFAEELQAQLVPGTMHLDQVPPTAARPYSEAKAQQQPRQQEASEQQAFGWLGGLLFGKRRAGHEGGGSRLRQVDANMWREFERDFTEV